MLLRLRQPYARVFLKQLADAVHVDVTEVKRLLVQAIQEQGEYGSARDSNKIFINSAFVELEDRIDERNAMLIVTPKKVSIGMDYGSR